MPSSLSLGFVQHRTYRYLVSGDWRIWIKALVFRFERVQVRVPRVCVLDRITFCMFGVCKPSLPSKFVVWLFVVLGLSFASEMYRGIGGRRSLSEENLRTAAQPRRNVVTLDEHAVNFEKMAVLKRRRGGYASHLTRK